MLGISQIRANTLTYSELLSESIRKPGTLGTIGWQVDGERALGASGLQLPKLIARNHMRVALDIPNLKLIMILILIIKMVMIMILNIN